MILEFKSQIEGLKKSIGNFLLEFSDNHKYNSLIHYVMGLEVGLKSELNGSQNFQTWFDLRAENKSNVHWAPYIFIKLADKDENRAIELTLEFLEEYANYLDENDSSRSA